MSNLVSTHTSSITSLHYDADLLVAYSDNRVLRSGLIDLILSLTDILTVLSLAGCVSTSLGIPDIYILALSDGFGSARIGYFGSHSMIAVQRSCTDDR